MLQFKDLKAGQKVRFFTKGEEQSVVGTVIQKRRDPLDKGGYADVYIQSINGDLLCFSTGGHLGTSWTQPYLLPAWQEWFCEEAK